MHDTDTIPGRDGWTLLHGDALKHLAQLPDRSVDAVITDPPYSSGGATQAERKRPVKEKYESTGIVNGSPDFVGDARDQRAYQYWSALWLSECLRIAKPGALLAVFTDWRQYAATADAIQAGGWTWRGTLAWVKPLHASRPQLGRFSQSCEFVLWGTAGPRPIEGAAHRGWWELTAPRGADRLHVTEKPVELMEHLIAPVQPGGIILDPFAGSGTTGVAALRTGRRFIGIEQTSHYCATARKRLASIPPPLPFEEEA
ncbi:MAG: site-specific DNA-methyltransferase [Propionibacteriaceae bacterium]|nr:site-specific DNA-methyltransferase [Propionibacteriaceae bacterium]